MTNLISHNRSAQREMLDLVDRFVVLSDWAKSVLIANGAPEDKIALNRLGVRFPQEAASRPRAHSPITVAYIGRFDLIKGASDFAQAIAMVPRSLPVRFEFHGPVRFRPEAEVLEQLKKLVGPDTWVTFGGELDGDGVRAALKRIDVICCPSHAVEGGPTIALEAHAAGVPVIGTAIPALSELVSDGVNGRLYPAGDAGALAAIIASLAENPDLIDRWRTNLPCVRTMDDVTRDYLTMYTQ